MFKSGFSRRSLAFKLGPNVQGAIAVSRVFIVVIAVVLTVGILGPEAAEAWTNPHGNYSDMTDVCAACHRTHTAVGPGLIVASTVRALCDTCHEGYQGSDYDVENGTIMNGGANTPSLAGPFSASAGSTSSHLIETPRNPLYVPGGPSASSTPLTCVSCHSPHGSSNYRMFRSPIEWNGLNVDVPNFTATLINPLGAETVTYQTGSVAACTACHTDYGQGDGGSYSDGHRHKVGVAVPTPSYTPGTLPLEQQVGSNQLVCLTCHYAHGTTVTNTPEGGREAYSTSLKRYGDAAMCSGCHFNNW